MLKRFFLNVLSSFAGAWIAIVLFVAVCVAVCVGLVAKIGVSSVAGSSLSSHSVLHLSLSGMIEEVETARDFDYISMMRGNMSRPQTLNSLVKALEEGATNKNIDALFIECRGAQASMATLNSLREAVADFKKSGKKVYAYGDMLTTGDLFVSSCADSLWINPGGEIEMKGISGTTIYYKDLLDKLGISFQVVKVGTFKSAVEPYIMTTMSEPARAQLDTLFGNIWRYVTGSLCENRKGLTRAKLDSLVSRDFISYSPLKLALDNNFVDKALYRREVMKRLADAVGVEEEDLSLVAPSELVAMSDWGMAYGSKKQIALLYATGEIVDGGRDGIDFETLVPEIISLAEDDNVKAMVLRVNSPGGSAFGSEQIGEALDYFMSKGKKLAVSMGDYAASGGYWISCGADVIFADPMTITGSIGIFGLIPNVENLMTKVGLNPQIVSTAPSANFPSLYKNMDASQQASMQAYVERGYDKFVSRVAKGRGMKKESVLRIAEGRVWDGATAQRIGLVDSLGSLRKAIEWTAKASNLGDSYDVAIYPQLEKSIWDFIPDDATFMRLNLVRSLMNGTESPELLQTVATMLHRRPLRAEMAPVTVRL